MNAAQEIADAVLAKVEGEELLVEAMARALCKHYQPNMDPDAMSDWTDGEKPTWENWRLEAKAHLLCDRVMRGVADKIAYDKLIKEQKA